MMVVTIKKQKVQKCVIKRKVKFKYCKNCLEATQPENKTKHQEKSTFDADIL